MEIPAMSQKERIIREAAAMFLDEGIKSVRMDDIATRLGVSKRTLYEMFGDKQDLLEQSLKYHFERSRDEMHERTREAANVFEEIFIMMDATKEGEHNKVLIGSLKKFYPEMYRRLEEEAHRFSHREFDRLLDRGMEQGLFMPDMNKELAVLTLTFTMTALFDQKHRLAPLRGNISVQMAFEYVIINFFRGLATHKGIETIDGLVAKYRNKKDQL
jgi:AcrR family transcriptional regulator